MLSTNSYIKAKLNVKYVATNTHMLATSRSILWGAVGLILLLSKVAARIN